jgi:hypothetical protein
MINSLKLQKRRLTADKRRWAPMIQCGKPLGWRNNRQHGYLRLSVTKLFV